MAELVGELTARLLADTKEFTAKMGEAKAEMDDVSESGSGAFSKLATLGKAALFGIGAVAIGIGVESVKLASTFQESMGQIQAATGISAKAANAMGNAFLSTAGKTEQSGNAIAEAYAPVAAQLDSIQGHALTAGQALGVMTAASNLADAKMGSLSDTTSDLAGVMQAFQTPVSQAAKVSDILYSAANITGQGLDGLSNAMEKVRSKMGALSPPIGQLGGLLVDMTEHGETGRAAMTALGSALTGLIAPTGTLTTAQQQTQDEQKKYGLSFETAGGQMKSLGSIIAEVQPVIKGMGNAQAISTLTALGFGSASAKLLDVIKAGPAGYAKAEAAVTRQNAAQKAAQIQAQTLAGMMHTLEALVEDYGIRLGRVLIPKLELFAKDTAKVVEWLAKEKVIAIALAGIITGVLGVAITAFAVQTIGKLITNVQKAYNWLLKLFGMQGAPKMGAMQTDAQAAGNDLANAIDAAGKQLILDAQTAAAALETGGITTGDSIMTGADTGRDALETGGDETRDAMETGADTGRDALETGGDETRDAMETGADTSRDALETGGDTARDAIETGGDTGRDALETGGDTTRDAIETGADTGRDALETGGDTARDAIETGGDTGRDALETGGSTAEADVESGGDAARDALETGGTTAETDVEAGGDAARDALETGGATGGEEAGLAVGSGLASSLGKIAFGAIIGTQVLNYINGKLGNLTAVKTGQKNFAATSGTTQSVLNALSGVPLLGSAVKTGEDLAFATGAYGNTPAAKQTNYSVNTGTASQSLPSGTTAVQASDIQKLVTAGMGTTAAVKAVEAKTATAASIAKLIAAQQASAAKAAKTTDVAKTTAAVNKTTADVKANTTATKSVASAVKSASKPITIHNKADITLTIDGKVLYKELRDLGLNNARAQGQNAINAGPGRGTGNA